MDVGLRMLHVAFVHVDGNVTNEILSALLPNRKLWRCASKSSSKLYGCGVTLPDFAIALSLVHSRDSDVSWLELAENNGGIRSPYLYPIIMVHPPVFLFQSETR